jgi:hypothetical protein
LPQPSGAVAGDGLGFGRFLGSLGGFRVLDCFPLLHELLEYRLAVLRGDSPDTLPVLDPAGHELDPRFLVGNVRIVHAQFLDDLPIPRLAMIDGNDPVIMPVSPAHLFHPNANGHGKFP